jgi:hypothetical protein
MLTVGAPIVGLGVFGQSLVVCTTSNPYLISGSTPGAMTQEKLPLNEPCVSKKSIVGDQFGVLYASPNGVVSIAPGSMDVISRPLMTRDEWQNYGPTSIIGAIYQNMYMAFYESGTTKSCLVFMRGDSPPLITLENDAKAVFVDNTTANVYVAQSDNKIYQLDGDTVNNMFFEWMSKKFIMPLPVNFAALKVQADWVYIGDTAAYNATVAQIIAANQAIWAAGGSLRRCQCDACEWLIAQWQYPDPATDPGGHPKRPSVCSGRRIADFFHVDSNWGTCAHARRG